MFEMIFWLEMEGLEGMFRLVYVSLKLGQAFTLNGEGEKTQMDVRSEDVYMSKLELYFCQTKMMEG